MKKFALVFAYVLLLFACRPSEEAAAEEEVHLSGEIRNARTNDLKVGDFSTQLDALGQFELSFSLLDADYFEFVCGDSITLFLSPGDDITLQADAENFLETLSFSGKGAEVNHFLREHAQRDKEHSQSIAPIINDIFSLSEGEFITRLDTYNSKFLNPLEEFLEGNKKVEKKFARYERAKLLYSWAEALFVYPQVHRDVTGDYSFSPSEGYFDFLSKLDVNDPELLEVEEYKSFLSTYMDDKKQQILERDPDIRSLDNQMSHLQYRTVLEMFDDQGMKDFYLFNMMKAQIENFGINGVENFMEGFKMICRNEEYLAKIKRLYDDEKTLRQDADIKIYKTIGNVNLEAHLFFPPDIQPGERRPAIVVFHGGGWNFGKAEWGYGRSRYFSSRGMIAVSAQYRLRDRHGTTPVECIADAKSIIRWMRKNAKELHVDPDRIAAAGWSAGGHIAACAGIVEGFDEPFEDLSVSSKPDAMVFWFPAVNIKGDNWFGSILQGRVESRAVCPTQHVRPGNPPTIIFQGTEDSTVSFQGVKEFVDRMKNAGNRCDLHAYEGREHLFHYNPEDYVDTMVKADRFLISLGFLEGEPDITALKK